KAFSARSIRCAHLPFTDRTDVVRRADQRRPCRAPRLFAVYRIDSDLPRVSAPVEVSAKHLDMQCRGGGMHGPHIPAERSLGQSTCVVARLGGQIPEKDAAALSL